MTIEEFAEKIIAELGQQEKQYEGALGGGYKSSFLVAIECVERAFRNVLQKEVDDIRRNRSVVGRTGMPGTYEVRDGK